MGNKISVQDIEAKIDYASTKTELASLLGVTKQYLDFFLKNKKLKIESSLSFKVMEKKNDN